MKAERWRKAEEIFHAALERPSHVRSAFLDEACADDAELRRQVGILVSEDERAGSFLERPALADLGSAAGGVESFVGREIGPYRIVSRLGAGGMGEVYRAHDARLGRDVAVKTLPPAFARDPARLARLRHEARTLASLNHPNIATLYGLEQSGELDHLVLELVEGKPLGGPLPLGIALDRACQLAEALKAAHARGIVHRDLKPANVKVSPDGRVKVLDFGLATALRETERHADLPEAGAAGGGSGAGHVAGTPGYMSPEQARGAKVDQRADVWAFGCLLFELLAGTRAFEGESVADTVTAVLEREPDWQALPADTPAKLRNLLRQCLEKDAGRRLQSIGHARATLEAVQRASNRRRLLARASRPRMAFPAAAILLLLGFLGVRQCQHGARVRWVREQAVPEIGRLMDAGELPAAFRLMRRADSVLPGDAGLAALRHDISVPTSFQTNPPGAEVWVTGYDPDDDDWMRLGTTPFTTRDLPWGLYRVRIVKPGVETVLGTVEVQAGTTRTFDLDREGALPPEMVRVPGGMVTLLGLDSARVGSFLIDRYEVTNREFKRFVDLGGYQQKEYWKQELVRDGRRLSWEEALQMFHDSTGRAGPSTWQSGNYPPGHDDYPVNGVSWYEAAAYAEFAGKQLPTIYHWQQAANPGWFWEVARISNFSGAGPAPVGSYRGVGAFGTLDMGGNVREWCWNEIAGDRSTRGGAWNEPTYMFADLDARSAWDRSAQNGIRCIRDDAPDASALRAFDTRPGANVPGRTPVPDDVFRLYQGLYAYDPADLDARVEGVDEENEYWRREKVSFAAAYGNERVTAYLYIPKQAAPPYQTILYANPGMAMRLGSPEPGEERLFDFVVKGGRAFLHPVLKGYYQRRYTGPPAGPNAYRDRLVLESKDFRRAIDYLVSRPDVDRDRLGVFGYSRGAIILPILAAGESRLKAAALVSVGLAFIPDRLPEADPFNFLPRFRVPTLVANGRSDFLLPVETSQRPFVGLLGADEADKRFLIWDGSHGDALSNYHTLTRETLAWFDRYLDPVR